MGLFSKKKNTNVTQTGLGDEQFEDLTTGQNTIRQDIGSLGVQTQAGFDQIGDQFSYQNDQTKTRFDTVDDTLSGISGSVNTGFEDVMAGQSDLATNVDTRLAQTDANLNTGFANLSNTIDSGVDTVTNTVDTRTGEIQDNINTQFNAANRNIDTGFSNLSNTVNTNDAVLLANQTEGFANTGEKIDDVGTSLGNQLTETSSNVLTGQDAMTALIDKYGEDAALYYQDLASGQAAIRENQGTMQTAFDSYLQDFGDYTTLANQTRTDLGNTVVGGFDTMGQIMGNQAAANQEGFSQVGNAVSGVAQGVADVTSDVATAAGASETNFGDIAASISGVGTNVSDVGDAVDDAASATQTNFGSIATDIATGFTSQSSEGVQRQNEFVDTLNSVQNILQTDTGSLDATVKANYQSLVDSFDEQGNLISDTVTAEGNTITRALSEQGDLFIAEFDANGQRIAQQTLDINSLLNNVSTFESNMQEQFVGVFGDAQVAEESRQSILDAFTITDGLIEDLGTGVTDELTNSFNVLSASFDEQGNLIRSEITESGTEIRRDLDSQGNLITTEIDQAGEVIGQTSLDIESISAQLNGMQAGLGDSITTAFDSIQNSSDELRANLVTNLDGLRNIMTTQGDTLSAELQESFMALSSSFDENGDLIRTAVDANGDFIFREINANGELVVSTIDDATGQLIESNKFNAEVLTTDLDARFNTADEFLQAIDASIQQVGGDINQGLNSMAAGLEEGFTTRFDQLSEEERAGRQQFTNLLTQTSALLEEDVADLDVGLRNSLTELTRAFDSEGGLIATAIDQNGNMLKRSIDDSGQLVLSTYSRLNGQLLDQQALDINRLLKEVSNMSVVQGSNASMGGQSVSAGAVAPAPAYSGFTSPYAQTY